MANYWQFRARHPEQKLIYYVCGEEMALRLEVLDSVAEQWPKEFRRLVQYVHGFAALESEVLSSEDRFKVIIATDADKYPEEQRESIARWAWMIVQGKLPHTALIVATAEINPDTSLAFYRPFVEKGRFVECKQLSVENMKKYAIEDYRLTEPAADELLELVSFNFTRLNNELEKLACLDLPSIDENVIRELVVFSADDLLVNHLLKRNPQALKVVGAVPASMVTPVLNVLSRKLSFLHGVIQNDAPGIGAHKLAAMLGVQPWQLLEYFAIKRYWSVELVMVKLKLLVQLEQQYAQQATNILPLLAAWW